MFRYYCTVVLLLLASQVDGQDPTTPLPTSALPTESTAAAGGDTTTTTVATTAATTAVAGTTTVSGGSTNATGAPPGAAGAANAGGAGGAGGPVNASKAAEDLSKVPHWPIPPIVPSCQDFYDACRDWAKSGECQNNPVYMELYCRNACQKCGVRLSQPDQRYYKPDGSPPAFATNSPIADWNSLIPNQPGTK